MKDLKAELGKTIWEASRADEGTITALGADKVADAILSKFDVAVILKECSFEVRGLDEEEISLSCSIHGVIVEKPFYRSLQRLVDIADEHKEKYNNG